MFTQFAIDDTYQMQERKSYNLIDAFSATGGLMGVIYTFARYLLMQY